MTAPSFQPTTREWDGEGQKAMHEGSMTRGLTCARVSNQRQQKRKKKREGEGDEGVRYGRVWSYFGTVDIGA